VIQVPGFSDEPIALAVMDDGASLVLYLAEGEARVVGTFKGPIGEVVSGDWAIDGLDSTAFVQGPVTTDELADGAVTFPSSPPRWGSGSSPGG
jgi:hypothetical protein